MKVKTIFQFAFIMTICITNYMMMLEYNSEYVPDNFDVSKIAQQKYRCIRYFTDKMQNRYLHTRCKPFFEDYVIFRLEKSKYIYAYYAHNAAMITCFALFHLLLL
jgi:hypothetical protein